MRISDISKVLFSLSPKEVEVLGFVLSSSDSHLLLRLHNLLMSGVLDEITISKNLYDLKPSSKYSHLKLRYYNTILSVMRLSNSNRQAQSNENAILIERLSSFISILNLLNIGMLDLAYQELDKAILKDYQSVELDLFGLYLMNRCFGVSRLTLKQLDSYLEISKDRLSYLERILVNEFKLKIIASSSNGVVGKSQEVVQRLNSLIEACINDVRMPDRMVSDQDVRSSKLLLRFDLLRQSLSINKNEDAVLSVLTSYGELIKNSSLSNQSDFGAVLFIKSVLSIERNDLENGLLFSELAIKYFIEGSDKYYECLRCLLLCCALLRKDTLFYQYFANYMTSPLKYSENEGYNYVWYVRCGADFIFGNTDNSLLIVNRLSHMNRDKYVWRVGLKYMLLLLFIERKEFMLIESHIDSFRKLLAVLVSDGVVCARMKIVISICRSLLRNMFDFSKVYSLKKDDLRKLRLNDGVEVWDPLKYELIRFDDWFLSKYYQNKTLS